MIIHANKEVTTALIPLRFVAAVRCSWVNITSNTGVLIASFRLVWPDMEDSA